MSVAPRLEQAKRSWGNDDSCTPILHVDMDAFFVEAELLQRPELRGTPVIVGGRSGRGVVTSASYEARDYGVKAGIPMLQARQLCPHATVLPTSKGYYSQLSRKVMKVLADITPVIETVSIDEAFMDVSGARARLGTPYQIAVLLRQKLREQLGLPASVGIAASKMVAKIASAHAKPDGILLIPRKHTTDFLWILPVGAMWGVGRKTQQRLSERGMTTIGDLAHEPVERLIRLLGESAGRNLHLLANGIDERIVEVQREDKSFSAEKTFEHDISQRAIIERVLLEQSHQCAYRLRKVQVKARTVSIKVRSADFRTVTRSRQLPVPSNTAADIVKIAYQLFGDYAIPSKGIRLIGVRVDNLVDASVGYQMLFDDNPKDRQRERALDLIKDKFGADMMKPAALLDDTNKRG
ncbi:MAG: DNA polymerase IV [Actinomycetaceae bacterium]|nr:DNA polymerase IV [Actinomycetaceae bacterium]